MNVRLCDSEIPLRCVAWLYVAAIVTSLSLTIYVVMMWRVALPSYDVVDHHKFLAAASLGEMDWQGLWERHNGMHLIALPKLVFWLDMYAFSGQGFLVTAVSVLAIVVTLGVLIRRIIQFEDFFGVEKAVFILLSVLMFSSVFMAESLLNPIDVQWSLLVMGSVLLASALYSNEPWSLSRILCALTAFFVCWLSAGPLVLMLFSLLMTWLLTSKDVRIKKIMMSICVFCVCLVVFVFIWEVLSILFGFPLFFPNAIKIFLPDFDVGQAESYLRGYPGFYIDILESAGVFFGRFALIPWGHKWVSPALVIIPFLVWSVILCKSLRAFCASNRFFVYLLVFSILICVSAGVVRGFSAYNYRHANIGFLLLLSSLLLIYGASGFRGKILTFSSFLVGYLVFFMVVAVDEAGAWSYEGQNITRYLQIGDAVGVRDPARFSPVWKVDAPDNDDVERSRKIFYQQRAGVYGSSMFGYYIGDKKMPEKEVACRYQLLDFSRNFSDARAFSLLADIRPQEGGYMKNAVFIDGKDNVGWAAAQVSSDKLWLQWSGPRLLGGYMVFHGTRPDVVKVVAFDDERRCQPWSVSLPMPK